MRKKFTRDIRNIVVKVGTSTLTKNGRFDKRIIQHLASEISAFLKKGIRVSIVSSGAIGAGMTILKMKKRPTAMQELQAAAAVGQRYLMQCYEEAFSRRGLSTAQVLLTWADLAEKKRYLNAKHTLMEIQKRNLVPVINENDTVATDEIRFGDNDRLSALLSILVEADLLVILSDTDGLYAGGKSGQRIPEVEAGVCMERIYSHVKEKRNSFTVGGMLSKLKAIHMSVNAGVEVLLADGRDKNVLTRLLEGGDLGTYFPRHPAHARKSWAGHFEHHIRK